MTQILSIPVVLFKDNEWSNNTHCLLPSSQQFANLKPKIIQCVEGSANSDVRYTFDTNIQKPSFSARYVVNRLTIPLADDKTMGDYLMLHGCTIVVVDRPDVPIRPKPVESDTKPIPDSFTEDQIRFMMEHNLDFDGDRIPVPGRESDPPSVVVLGIRCVLKSFGTNVVASSLEARCLASDTIRTLRETVWQTVSSSEYSKSLFRKQDYDLCIRSKATPDHDQVVLDDSDLDKTVSMLSNDIVLCLVPKRSTPIGFFLRQPMSKQAVRIDLTMSDTARTLYARVADLLRAEESPYISLTSEQFSLVAHKCDTLIIPNSDKTLYDLNILTPACQLTIVEKQTVDALSGNDKIGVRPSTESTPGNVDDVRIRVHKKVSADELAVHLTQLDNEIRALNDKAVDFVKIEAFLECKKKYANACEAIHNVPAKYLISISADYGGASPKIPNQETMDLVAKTIQDARDKVEMLLAVKEYKVLMARSDVLWEKLSQHAKDDQLDLAVWGL